MASTTARHVRTGIPEVDKALDDLRKEVIKPSQPIRVLRWGANDLGTVTDDRFLYPGYDSNTALLAERGAHIVTTEGRLRNLYAWHYNEGSGAATITYVIRVNGRDTPLHVLVPNTSYGLFTPRNKVEVPVKAGDIVTCAVRKSATIVSSTSTALVTLELV